MFQARRQTTGAGSGDPARMRRKQHDSSDDEGSMWLFSARRVYTLRDSTVRSTRLRRPPPGSPAVKRRARTPVHSTYQAGVHISRRFRLAPATSDVDFDVDVVVVAAHLLFRTARLSCQRRQCEPWKQPGRQPETLQTRAGIGCFPAGHKGSACAQSNFRKRAPLASLPARPAAAGQLRC